jgi:hypothetical protein
MNFNTFYQVKSYKNISVYAASRITRCESISKVEKFAGSPGVGRRCNCVYFTFPGACAKMPVEDKTSKIKELAAKAINRIADFLIGMSVGLR